MAALAALMAERRANPPPGARPTLRNVVLCGPDSWDTQAVYDGAGWRLQASVVCSALLDRSVRQTSYRQFLTAMDEAGVDIPDSILVGAYDAATLALEALRAGETGREAVAVLRDTGRTFPLVTGAVSISGQADIHKSVQVRIVEIPRNGWPTPSYVAGTR